MQTTDFTNFMGIDVSKQTWDVYLSPSGQRRKLSANDDGARQLREALSSVGRCLIVMEATGGLEQRLVAELHDAGHTVAVVNPRQVRDFARCMNRLAKPMSWMPRRSLGSRKRSVPDRWKKPGKTG